MKLLKAFQQAFAVIFLLSAIALNILFVRNSIASGQLYDFGSFLASGQEAAAGNNPYTVDNPLVFKVFFDKAGIGSQLPNANPPISVVLFELLARQPPLEALNIWRAVSALLYLFSVSLLFITYKEGVTWLKMIWALSLAGFWHSLQLGQIYAVILLLISGAWILIDKKRKKYAAVLVGLAVAIKPNLIVWPLLAGLAGDWLFFVLSAATAGFVSVIPLILFGPGIYLQWLAVSGEFSALPFPGNNSLIGLFVRFATPESGLIASFLLFVFLLYWLWKEKPTDRSLGGVGITASLLISPIAWTGYTIMLLPFYLATPRWDKAALISAAILAIPFPIVLAYFQQSALAFIAWGWLYGWALLILLMGLLLAGFQQQTTRP